MVVIGCIPGEYAQPVSMAKIDDLRVMMQAEDWPGALRRAARFPRLGALDEPIRLGWSAMSNPGFYRQIHKDPDAMIQAGIQALRERYSSAA